MSLNKEIMVKKKIGYKVSVFRWNRKDAEVLTFYHMTEKTLNEWVENLLYYPFSAITHVVVEQFKIYSHE